MRMPIDMVTILPVEPIGRKGLEELCDVLQAEGIRVVLKPPILRPRDAYDARRRQFRAEALLERARSCTERPILAVTDADCYAGSLNFVFGMAEVGGRAATVSLHRLRDASTGERFHQRIAKEVIHELGHGEGLGHCRDPKCVMRFSNSLAETDAKSKGLCPACLRHLRTRAAARAAGGSE
jgi:archaemetzincin